MSMPPNAAPHGGPQPQETVTVLLVDDQPVIALVVKKMLSVEPGIAFHVCHRAADAVATALQVRPTVIVQDLVMPGADGLDLVQAYRATPEIKDVPIIVLSSNDEPIMKQSAFARGANDYMVKLPEPIELVARIRYHSRAYTTLLQRDQAYRELRVSQLQLLKSNLELRRLTNSDGLTGLANRRSFDDFMARHWAASMSAGAPISLLMIDVDSFKSYNDHLGHLAGDDALRRVALTLRAAHEDASCLAARFGGEEFALVLPDVAAPEAAAIGERLRGAVEEMGLPHPASHPPNLSVSIGVATMVASADTSSNALIEMADARLYQAKCAGRNRVVCG